MRWFNGPKMKDYDTRIRVDYLFFPRCIGGEWRWMEHAKWLQIYLKENPLSFRRTWRDWEWL